MATARRPRRAGTSTISPRARSITWRRRSALHARARRQAPTVRGLSRARTLPGRARRAGGAGPATALDPVQRHADEPRAAGSRQRPRAAALDGVLSVDEVDVYKPSPRVYALAGGDARAAGAAGSRSSRRTAGTRSARSRSASPRSGSTAAGAPVDRHGPPPRHILRSLAELPALVPAVLARA